MIAYVCPFLIFKELDVFVVKVKLKHLKEENLKKV